MEHNIKESINQLVVEYDNENTSFHGELEKLNFRAEKLAKKIEKFKNTKKPAHYKKSVLIPICEALQVRFGALYYELLGPSGIYSKYSLYLWMEEEKEDNWDKCFSVTFRFFHVIDNKSRLGVVDYSVNTQEYAKNTIGAVNGSNHPTIFIEDWSVDQLVEFIKKQKEIIKSNG